MAAVDVKLVLLGHKNVGKTALFNRYVYDEFGRTTMTIGAYFGMKQLRVADKMVNLAIWDTAGEERFDALTNFYCRGAACAVVCYDITAHETFTGLARWVDKLRGEENCCIVIVGNKLDAVEQNPSLRKVELAEAKQYATSIGAEVMEVSAKTGTGVSEAFSNVVDTAFERAGRGGRELGQQRDSRRVGVRAQPPQTTNPGGGCAC